MGKLIYDGAEVAVFDDRLLVHLQVAMASKLRRDESFFFTWTVDLAAGSGRTAIWVDSHVSMRFMFGGNKTPTLNRLWLQELVDSSNSPGGMRAIPEPTSS